MRRLPMRHLSVRRLLVRRLLVCRLLVRRLLVRRLLVRRLPVAALALVAACEHVDSLADAPALIPPAAPELETIRSASTVADPPPPAAAPIAPDLVGLPGPTKRWFLSLDAEQRHVVRQICRIQRTDPCFGLLAGPKGDPESEHDRLLAQHRELDMHGDVEPFCVHMNGSRNRCDTPLVVAFDGQPIEVAASPHRFAFRPGEPVASDWPTAATPWIALDRDGDGAITSGAELFGDATPIAGGARNGFEALAALDANRDGTIDARDPAFARLLLWADANGDRESSPDELSALAHTVVAIPLAHEVVRRCTNGNCEGERGTVVWRDGGTTRTGAVVDLYLRTR